MAEMNNSTCSICGKAYYKCLSCKDLMMLNPWKAHTDTSEHYKIYQIIRGYNTNAYTKDEANAKLQKVDLSDLNELRDNIQNLIKDIMTVDLKENIQENVQENVENTNPVEKKPRKRKSSKIEETEE